MHPSPEQRDPVWKRLIWPALRAILSTNDSPRQIAAGTALGVFVAFTPTMGIQMVLALFFATLLKVSRIPAIAMVYITNPLTAFPIYGFCYGVGVHVCRFFGLPVGTWAAFLKFKQALTAGADLGAFKYFLYVCATLGRLGLAIALPLWIGGIVVGLAAAALSYPLALRLVEGHRVLHAQRLARKLRKRARDEEAPESETPPPGATSGLEAAPTQKETRHEPRPGAARRTGTDRVDPPPEADASPGHRGPGG